MAPELTADGQAEVAPSVEVSAEGQFRELATALEQTIEGLRPLGWLQSRFEGTPALKTSDLLPDYRLRRRLAPTPALATLICGIAESAQAEGRQDITLALWTLAQALDDHCLPALLGLAQDHAEKGRPEEALATAAKAREAAPGSPHPWLLIGRHHLQRGEIAQAEAAFRRSLEITPTADGYWLRGNILARFGKLTAAEAHFRELQKIAPDFSENWMMLAELLEQSGRLDEALALAQAGVRDQALPHRLAQLAGLLVKAGREAEGRQLLEDLLVAEPRNSNVRCRLATLYAERGNFEQADSLLDTSLALLPDSPDLWIARATLMRERRPAKRAAATGIAEILTARWPERAEGWYLLGLGQLDSGNIFAAEPSFARAQALAPGMLPAILARADTLAKLSRPADAVWLLEKLLEDAPPFDAALLVLVRYLLDLGQPQEARRRLAMLAQPRTHPGFWLALSRLLTAQRRFRGAWLAGRRALARLPHDHDCLQQAVRSALDAGEMPEAGHRYADFLKRHPDVGRDDSLAFEIHWAAGDTVQASGAAERLLAANPVAPEHWLRLAEVRARQQRIAEAEEALHQAAALAPERADIPYLLSCLLDRSGRKAEGVIAALKACELAPEDVTLRAHLAELRLRNGDHMQALAAARQAAEAAPDRPELLLLVTRMLHRSGQASPSAILDRLRPLLQLPVALSLLAELAAEHAPALDLLDRQPPQTRQEAYRLGLEQRHREGRPLLRLGEAAFAAFPENTDFELALLRARHGSIPRETDRQHLRHWARRHAAACGQEPPVAIPARTAGSRLRVAYITSQPRPELLLSLLQAHDPSQVELHLYADPAELPPEAAALAILHALEPLSLAPSCIANGIEVAIDLGGLHPFAGQAAVLRAFRRRIAPWQVGLGNREDLDSGLYDAMLDPATSEVAALEREWLGRRAEAERLWCLLSPKDRSRALARRRLEQWLADGERLQLPSADKPEISVVVLLFNQAGLSLDCLLALRDQEGPGFGLGFETILIDNASTDETNHLLSRIDGATIVQNQENVGFLAAANQGAALARGRQILFLNNDATLHANAIFNAARRLDRDPGIGIVGGRIILADGHLQEAGCILYRDGATTGYGRGQSPGDVAIRHLRDVDYVSGAFMMVRADLWRALGGFDPAFAPAYYEDCDFCLRAQRGGFRVVYDPSVLVNHLEWGSAAEGEAVALMDRNRDLLVTRHRAALGRRSSASHPDLLRDRSAWTGPRLLVIDNEVPLQSGGGGQPRAHLMLQAIAGYETTFLPLWRIDESWGNIRAAMPDGVEVILGCSADRLEGFLESRKGHYSHLLVSRPTNMQVVGELRTRRPELFADTRLVYDAEAIFALREIGQATVAGRPLGQDAADRLLTAEVDLARLADCVLAASEGERQLLMSRGVPDVRILAHAATAHWDTPDINERAGLLFVGAMHPGSPNEDGLLWFLQEVLPRLNRRLAHDVPVILAGELSSPALARALPAQVHVTGRVQNLSDLYRQARVFIAPTRFGSGVPAKVIEATAAGIPVVGTELLARQLGWQAGNELLTAADAEGFTEQVERLYREQDLWRTVQQAGLRRIDTDFAPRIFARTLAQALAGTP